mgnify:CR=1 FL=1
MYASEPRGAHARLGLAAGREVTCFGAHERTRARLKVKSESLRLGLSGEPFAFLQRRRAAVKHTSANTIMKPSTQDPRRRTRAADLVQCVYHQPHACYTQTESDTAAVRAGVAGAAVRIRPRRRIPGSPGARRANNRRFAFERRLTHDKLHHMCSSVL